MKKKKPSNRMEINRILELIKKENSKNKIKIRVKNEKLFVVNGMKMKNEENIIKAMSKMKNK